jgi:hypothetical protein
MCAVSDAATESGPSNVPELTLRIVFFGLALVAFWAGVARWNVWAEASLLETPAQPSVAQWVTWQAVVAMSGFFFTLAAFPPGAFRYRLGTPLLLAAVPTLLLAHTVVLYGVRPGWLPDLFATTRFYMNSPFQFGLATWVGVAFASGFSRSADSPARGSSQSGLDGHRT